MRRLRLYSLLRGRGSLVAAGLARPTLSRLSLAGPGLVVLPILLMFSGCAPWRVDDTPLITPLLNPKKVTTVWVAACNDPLAQRLIQELVDQNLDLKIAASRVTEARSTLGVIQADLFPDLSANVAVSRGNAGGGGLKPYSLTRGGVRASWDTDLFGATRAQVRGAAWGIEETLATADQVRLGLVAELFTTLIQWRYLRQALEITQAQVSLLDKQVKLLGVQVNTGLTDTTSLETLQVQRHQTATQLPLLKASLKVTQSAIEKLLGRSPDALNKLFAQDTNPLKVPDIRSTLSLSLEVVRLRPDVRAAKAHLLAAQANVDYAEASLWPQITLGNFFGAQRASKGLLFSPSNPLWTLSAGLSFPLLDFGRLRGAIDVSQAQAKQAELAYEKTVLTAVHDIHTSLKTYIQGLEATHRLTLALASADASARTARKRFEAGLTDEVAVLAAQSTTCQAAITLAGQQAVTAQAFVTLQKALNAPVS